MYQGRLPPALLLGGEQCFRHPELTYSQVLKRRVLAESSKQRAAHNLRWTLLLDELKYDPIFCRYPNGQLIGQYLIKRPTL
jgi:hypothetical protein